MLQPQEALEDRLERAWSPVSHLHAVADSRSAARRLCAGAGKDHRARDRTRPESRTVRRGEQPSPRRRISPRCRVPRARWSSMRCAIFACPASRSKNRRARASRRSPTRWRGCRTNSRTPCSMRPKPGAKRVADEAALAGLAQTDRALLREYAQRSRPRRLARHAQAAERAGRADLRRRSRACASASMRRIRRARRTRARTPAASTTPRASSRSWRCATKPRSCSASPMPPRNRWRRRWPERPSACWRSCTISPRAPSRWPSASWPNCARSRATNSASPTCSRGTSPTRRRNCA